MKIKWRIKRIDRERNTETAEAANQAGGFNHPVYDEKILDFDWGSPVNGHLLR